MDIMNMFRTAVATPSAIPANMAAQQNNQTVATGGQPGNLPVAQPGMIAGASADGQIPGGNATPTTEPSPMKEFENLWQIDKPADGAYVDAPIRFNADPAKVQAAAKSIDFSKTVTPALLEQIKAGGEGAMQATLQAMNEMAQQVFAQSMLATSKVVEAGAESTYQRTQTNLPNQVRKVTVGNALREDNPLFTNPATAPMMEMFEQQALAKFPNASSAEITQMARTFMVSFAGEAAKLAPEDRTAVAKSNAGREQDWSQVPII